MGSIGDSANEVLLNGFKDLAIDGRSFAVVKGAGFASKSYVSLEIKVVA